VLMLTAGVWQVCGVQGPCRHGGCAGQWCTCRWHHTGRRCHAAQGNHQWRLHQPKQEQDPHTQEGKRWLLRPDCIVSSLLASDVACCMITTTYGGTAILLCAPHGAMKGLGGTGNHGDVGMWQGPTHLCLFGAGSGTGCEMDSANIVCLVIACHLHGCAHVRAGSTNAAG
jgi:hypothetical protein